jgi:dTDP-4-amino-4,6-dideoxygalactose transaminase
MIPFVDLKAQYHSIQAEIQTAIAGVFESSQFVLGGAVAAFERDFAAYCGVAHALGVNTGTSALHLALLAAGIGAGDEVITTPFTFVATSAAIGYTGARAVYVDIEPASFTLDPARLEQAITPRTRAIMPVHLYGQMADMDPIMEIARQHGLIVIEDAAQAHGAEYHGRRAGSIGDLGCFSFYPGKNLGAYGEGGLVTTNNPKYAETIRLLRDWGAAQKYVHTLRGFNYRMEGLQGAILGVKLRHLDDWTEARRAHALDYSRALAGAGVALPQQMAGRRHVYHVYAIRTQARESLQAALLAQGIHTGIHYPIPVHLQPAYADPQFHAGDFPSSEQAANEVLSLPMFAELRPEQIETVAGAVRSVQPLPLQA